MGTLYNAKSCNAVPKTLMQCAKTPILIVCVPKVLNVQDQMPYLATIPILMTLVKMMIINICCVAGYTCLVAPAVAIEAEVKK